MKQEVIELATSSGPKWGIRIWINGSRHAMLSNRGKIMTFDTKDDAQEYIDDV